MSARKPGLSVLCVVAALGACGEGPTAPLPMDAPAVLSTLDAGVLALDGPTLFDFNDLVGECAPDAEVASPYPDLVFEAPALVAVCVFDMETGAGPTPALLLSSFDALMSQTSTEVRIGIGGSASEVQVTAYVLNPDLPAVLVAYDASGAILDADTATTVFGPETLTVMAPDGTTIATVGLQGGTFGVVFDDLLVTPAGGDPTTRDACKNGGWEAFGFRNQGQCVSFVETGRDRR